MLGEVISVIVTIDDVEYTDSTLPVTVMGELQILSAEQTGAATIEVELNKPVDTGYTFTVTKGSTSQTITTAFDDLGTTAKITLGTAIQDAEYTVKVANNTDKEDFDEAVVDGEIAKLASIDFLGDELILSDATLTKASTTLVGYNNFDEKVALTGSLTITSTKGVAKYTASTNKVEVDTSATAGLLFSPGETVTLTGVYTAGTTILQVSKGLTVSARAALTEFEVGELTTTNKNLQGKDVTIDNLKTNSYYFPVEVAKDQYGNDLSADDLDKMLVTTTATTGNLYINPYLPTGSYAYVNGFVELADGTIAMQIYKGSLSSPGTQPINITAVNGYQGSLEVDVIDNPYIASLTVSAPTFYDGEKAEITISAVDQNGDAYDLFGKVAGVSDGGKQLDFKDKNNLTTVSSYINVSDGVFSYKENSIKKTVTFFYTGTNSTTQPKNVVATIMPASAFASNQTWTVQPSTTVAGIKSFDKKLNVGVSGVIPTGTNTNFTWLSSSGAALDNTADYSKIPSYTNNVAAEAAAGYYYSVAVNAGWTVTSGNVVAPASITTSNNTATITVSLYYLETPGATPKYSEIAKKTFTATAFDGAAKSYSAKLASGSELLNATANSGDSTSFSVTEYDAQGMANPTAPTYTVTVTDDLGVSGTKVVPGSASAKAKGIAVATIWVGGKAVATVDVPYDVAAPAAQSVSTYDEDNKKTSTKDTFDAVTDMTLNSNGSLSLVDSLTNYTLSIVDQYNMPMKNTDWKLGGTALTTGTLTTVLNTTLIANSAKISGSWAITGAPINVINNASSANYNVDTEDALASAFTKAANDPANNTIKITKDIALTAGGLAAGTYTIASGDKLEIPSGVVFDATALTNAVTLKIANGGTIKLNGTLKDSTNFAINNDGAIKGSGHYTQTNYTQGTTGSINLTGATWEIKAAPTISGGTIGGNIEIAGGVAVDFSNATEVNEDQPIALLGTTGSVKLPAGVEVGIATSTGAVYTVDTAAGGAATVTATTGIPTVTSTEATGGTVITAPTGDTVTTTDNAATTYKSTEDRVTAYRYSSADDAQAWVLEEGNKDRPGADLSGLKTADAGNDGRIIYMYMYLGKDTTANNAKFPDSKYMHIIVKVGDKYYSADSNVFSGLNGFLKNDSNVDKGVSAIAYWAAPDDRVDDNIDTTDAVNATIYLVLTAESSAYDTSAALSGNNLTHVEAALDDAIAVEDVTF